MVVPLVPGGHAKGKCRVRGTHSIVQLEINELMYDGRVESEKQLVSQVDLRSIFRYQRHQPSSAFFMFMAGHFVL